MNPDKIQQIAVRAGAMALAEFQGYSWQSLKEAAKDRYLQASMKAYASMSAVSVAGEDMRDLLSRGEEPALITVQAMLPYSAGMMLLSILDNNAEELVKRLPDYELDMIRRQASLVCEQCLVLSREEVKGMLVQ